MKKDSHHSTFAFVAIRQRGKDTPGTCR